MVETVPQLPALVYCCGLLQLTFVCSRPAHMEMEQGLPEQARPVLKRPRQPHESLLGRPPRSGVLEGVPEGRLVRQRVAHPALEPPKEKDPAEVQRIIFNSSSPSTQ